MNDLSVYSAMQVGEPLKRYKKAILGKVHISVLNPFSDLPEYVLLTGKEDEENSYIEIWSEKADMFLRKMNAKHFKAGRLVEMESKVVETASPNQLLDSEIDELLSSPFMSLQNKLKTFTDTVPLYRFLTRARELEKSEKIIKRIEESITKLTTEDLE